MTQYAIPGYHPIGSPKDEASVRSPYYKPVVLELPDGFDKWRLLFHTGFDNPKQLTEGDNTSSEYQAGTPALLTLDFETAEWAEGYGNGTFRLEILDSAGDVILTRGIEISD